MQKPTRVRLNTTVIGEPPLCIVAKEGDEGDVVSTVLNPKSTLYRVNLDSGATITVSKIYATVLTDAATPESIEVAVCEKILAKSRPISAGTSTRKKMLEQAQRSAMNLAVEIEALIQAEP